MPNLENLFNKPIPEAPKVEPKVEAKVEVKEEVKVETPHPFAPLIEAQKGRLESDIPMSDDYWKIKRSMQERGIF